MKEAVERIKSLLFRRQHAYQMIFQHDSAYTKIVLKDLALFCRAHESAFNSDARLHAVLEGRREVWLRVERYLKLSHDELWALHGGDVE